MYIMLFFCGSACGSDAFVPAVMSKSVRTDTGSATGVGREKRSSDSVRAYLDPPSQRL